jgi:hypothetical protein
MNLLPASFQEPYHGPILSNAARPFPFAHYFADLPILVDINHLRIDSKASMIAPELAPKNP